METDSNEQSLLVLLVLGIESRSWSLPGLGAAANIVSSRTFP